MIIIDKLQRPLDNGYVDLSHVIYEKDEFNRLCNSAPSTSLDYITFHRLSIDIYDTESKKLTRHLGLKDIASYLEEIYGVFLEDDIYTIVPLTVDVWNLIDFIDDVKYFGYNWGRPDQFVSAHYNNVVWLSEKDKCCTFKSGNKSIITIDVLSDMSPIDKYRLLWKSGNNYFTILALYYIIFNKISDFSCDMDVFLHLGNSYYRFDINSKVIRFMTKMKVLRK